MRRAVRWEPAVLALVGLVVSGSTWVLPAVERGRFEAPEAPATVLHPEVLVSPREAREVGLVDWLRWAGERPAAFRASRAFCRQHGALPLPNCRNVETAGRVHRVVGRGGRHDG